MRKLGFLIGTLLLLTGCNGWHGFIADLNERRVQSCIYYEGNAAAYVRVRGVTATGGMSLSECMGTAGRMLQ